MWLFQEIIESRRNSWKKTSQNTKIWNTAPLGNENNHHPIAIGALGTILKALKKYLTNIDIDKVTVEQLQQAIFLGTSNIIW